MSWFKRKAKEPEPLPEVQCPHVWEKWKHHKTVNVYLKEGDKIPVRREYIQIRTCDMCGLVQFHRQET